MNYLLLTALVAYVNAAVHAGLAFAYKRRAVERVALVSLALGFAVHTAAFLRDWIQDGHYPLFGLREALSFLAWTLVVAYGLAHFRYQLKALGAFLMPLVAFLVTAALLMRGSADARVGTIAAGAGGWIFPIHTAFLIFSYAAFFIVFAASAMYLWQERELKL